MVEHGGHTAGPAIIIKKKPSRQLFSVLSPKLGCLQLDKGPNINIRKLDVLSFGRLYI